LNNVVEQDHRAIKMAKRTRPMMEFKSFGSAVKIIAGIEAMHMVKKGQLGCPGGLAISATGFFYSLATE
jgi:transposase-like protein